MTNGTRAADVGAIIVAAGRGERMAGEDKIWASLASPEGRPRPLLAYSVDAFQRCAAIDRIALVLAADAVDRGRAFVREQAFDKVCAVVAGGARRQDSVRAGLDAAGAPGWVAVHDGARPLVTTELIEQALAAARETGASCCVLPIPDTVKEASEGFIVRTLDRARLWLAQTPQVFRYDLLVKAHAKAQGDATDDAAMVEALGVKVRLCEGSLRNLKVTTPEDLSLVRASLSTKRT